MSVERRVDAASGAAQQAGTDLAELVKNTIGVTVSVNVVEPDDIERSMGKMRRIVDRRDS